LIATHQLEALRYLDELGERDEDLMHEAFRWSKTAGDRTSALWQHAEAVRWYDQAQRLADALDLPAAERTALVRAHLDAATDAEPVDEVLGLAQRAVDVFEELDDPVGIGWARSQQVMPLFRAARHAESEQRARESIAILEPLGEGEELADALHNFGWSLWRQGRNEEAEPLLRRAVEMSERFDAPLVHAQATQTLAVCLSQTGRSAEAIETMEEAYRLAKEVGELTNLLRASANLGALVADLGSDWVRAEAVVREGLELAQRSGSKGNEAWLMGSLGDGMLQLGRLEESEPLQRLAIELAIAVGDQPLRGMRLSGLACVVLFRGRADEAMTIHEESLPVLEENPEPQSTMFIPMLDGYFALVRGAPGEAADAFARMIDQVRLVNVEGMPGAFVDVVRTHLRAGRSAEAQAYRDLSEHGRSPAARANAAVVEGMLSEDPMEARRLLAEGTAEIESIGMRIDAARAMVDLGRAIARVGEDPREVLQRARELLIECDARAFLFEVDDAIADLGVQVEGEGGSR
jgi:tetratricopeptide (TPR) repeat protein